VPAPLAHRDRRSTPPKHSLTPPPAKQSTIHNLEISHQNPKPTAKPRSVHPSPIEVADLIGVGVADEQALERVGEHDAAVPTLVVAGPDDLDVPGRGQRRGGAVGRVAGGVSLAGPRIHRGGVAAAGFADETSRPRRSERKLATKRGGAVELS